MPKRKRNIRKRKDGRWEGRVLLEADTTEKKRYKYIYGKTYKEVQEKIQQFLNRPKEEKIEATCSKTVDCLAKEWLNQIAQYKKYSTYIKYQNIYDTHIKKHIGACNINQINQINCMELLQYEYRFGNKKNTILSKSSLNATANVLKQILHYGGNEQPIGEIKVSIFSTTSRQRANIMVFSKDEQVKLEHFLLENMDSCKLGILLCQFTGLRLGEICALTTENIILNKRILRVTQTVQRIKTENEERKTKLFVSSPKTVRSMREIPICDQLFNILQSNMPNTKYLVNGDQLMEPRTYQYTFQRYLKKLCIEEKSFHTLRHTFATNCIENGMEVKCLSELLGHASVQTTLNKYVHPSFESKLKQMNLSLSYHGQNCSQNEKKI